MKNARVISTVVVVALLGAALALPGLSAANDGPSPSILWMIAEQQDQDVRLSFGIRPMGDEPSAIVREDSFSGQELELEFDGNLASNGWAWAGCAADDENWDNTFLASDLCSQHPELCVDCDEDEVPECFGDCDICPESVTCSAVPQLCTDCDGDSEPECTAGCDAAGKWVFGDRCVPPGSHSYTVFTENGMGGTYESVWIAVEDLGYAGCADDPDDDDGSAEDPDAEGGGGGCAVTGRAGANASSRPGLLPLLRALFPIRRISRRPMPGRPCSARRARSIFR